jgi:hypothetical protein
LFLLPVEWSFLRLDSCFTQIISVHTLLLIIKYLNISGQVFEAVIGKYWWESQKERDHWEDQDVGGWTIIKWILER